MGVAVGVGGGGVGEGVGGGVGVGPPAGPFTMNFIVAVPCIGGAPAVIVAVAIP